MQCIFFKNYSQNSGGRHSGLMLGSCAGEGHCVVFLRGGGGNVTLAVPLSLHPGV